MNNGRRCCPSCALIQTLMLGQSKNAAAFSLLSSGWLAQERNGDCFPKSTATGTRPTGDLRAGASKASSSSCIKHWLMMPTWSTCSLIRPSFALIHALLALQKKWRPRGTSVRSKSWQLSFALLRVSNQFLRPRLYPRVRGNESALIKSESCRFLSYKCLDFIYQRRNRKRRRRTFR